MFPGVSTLSLAEIRSDFKSILSTKTVDNRVNNDIHRNQDVDNETDSDSSIKSDDVLDSVYPVQPRNLSKSDRSAANFRHLDSNNNYSSGNIDGAMFYIEDIRRHRGDLYEGERLREELEQCSLVTIAHA